MHRIVLLAAFAAAAFAQTEQKPPADVDEALRARIKEFYQYHVDRQYRKAEKLVAEDSQDFFYEHNKPEYLSYDIKTITYSDNFTKAKVSVICEQYFHGLGFDGKPLKSPSTSTWKVVDGKWLWYVDADELAKGPFGKMANAGSKPNPNAKAEPPKIPTTADFALGKVKPDKAAVILKAGETQQLTLTNEMQGTVSLTLAQGLPGIEVTIDKANLNQGEKAVVTLKAGENPHTGEIAFRVQPTGEWVTVAVKRN